MRKLIALQMLALLLSALPAISHAQSGYTTKAVNLRAGPAKEYPAVALLPAGFPIVVVGCLADYRWCDVEAGPNRGWVYAANIAYPYQGANVPLLTYGAAIGIGVIAYSVGSYWDTHYHARPWYRQRDRWIERSRPGFRHDAHGPVHRPGIVGGHRPAAGPGVHHPGPAPAPGGHRPAPGPAPGTHRPSHAPGGSPGGRPDR